MQLVNNYRIRLIGILTVTALRFGFTSSDALAGPQPATWQVFLNNLLMALITGIIIWETNRAVVVYFNRTYPLQKLSARRFGLETLILLLVNAVVYVLTIAIYFFLQLEGQPPWIFLWFGLFDRFLYGMLVAAFYELLLFMEAWRKATKEAEELKKINLSVQLESLKNQVKPHFLFNSLNTLTGLVEQDTTQAVRFIAELSKVYRYLLQSNEKELIGLLQELQFTEAYFFLLRTRFGEGISLTIDVDENLHQYLIPPLTLQMLVENAVKHNQVSVRKPLQVYIGAEANARLVIRNNFQPKRNPVASNGMGLSNITAKYRLLNGSKVIIQNTEEFFTIKVPLIKANPV